jgi:prevent-host-death family protein
MMVYKQVQDVQMKLSERVKPISYLKAHASEVIREVVENQQTLVITHNGEAKVIVYDLHVYEQTQDYRILYEVQEQAVFVHAILDGRRDLRDLLERRLLR